MKVQPFSSPFFIALLTLLMLNACRSDDEMLIRSEGTQVSTGDPNSEIKGFFLLNEGNMGTNSATLDYYDYTTGTYNRNIYPERNPTVDRELGDVGNDIAIYGSKIYAVINCSNVVEVMDVHTATHITAIPVPNCRYLAFKDGYAYVSSYAGEVQLDPNSRLGYVAKIDTASLQVVDTCTVGYQPEDMVIIGSKLYVANSGGYRVPNYDETVSVIDLNEFKELKKIPVEINLHKMVADDNGNIYVTSRGDYYDIDPNTFVIDSQTDMVTDVLNVPANELCLSGDSLYAYCTAYSYTSMTWDISYTIYNIKTKQIVSNNFIKDGTETKITMPYGLAVNPNTKEIFVADAKDYITPGTIYCFSPEGNLKWSATTGDIPGHIVFTTVALEDID